jgi:hypothetical protein
MPRHLPVSLAVGLVLGVCGAVGGTASAAETAVRRERFLASPQSGQAVLAASFYSHPTGLALFSLHQTMSRSDTVDRAVLRVSPDHGKTWETVGEEPVRTPRPEGIQRRVLRGGVADPKTGRLVCFWLSALLPNDDPLEGMRHWTVGYRVSADGGRTWQVDEPVVQSGPEFSPSHPFPGVTTGRNAIMIGDLASVPLVLADGTFLVPVMVTPTGPEGNYHDPGGGYTYSDGAALRGRWRADGRIEWELSARIEGDPARSTRGMDEPTFAELADGRILAVLRGSNGGKPSLPGRSWAAFSKDAGRTWTAPQPWTYADGGDFSPRRPARSWWCIPRGVFSGWATLCRRILTAIGRVIRLSWARLIESRGSCAARRCGRSMTAGRRTPSV